MYFIFLNNEVSKIRAEGRVVRAISQLAPWTFITSFSDLWRRSVFFKLFFRSIAIFPIVSSSHS
jgi:hypothetical protein